MNQTKPLTPETKQRHEYLMMPPSGVVKRSIIDLLNDTAWAQSFPTMTAYRLALVKLIKEMK